MSVDPEIRRGKLRIAGPSGTHREVSDAALLSSVAVHRSIGGPAWTITHMATGCTLGHADTEQKALDDARDLERDHVEAFAELDQMKFATQKVKSLSGPVSNLKKALIARGLR